VSSHDASYYTHTIVAVASGELPSRESKSFTLAPANGSDTSTSVHVSDRVSADLSPVYLLAIVK